MRRIVGIIPVYNEAPHLRSVLASIEMQTVDRGRLFVIAVDGESTDGSTEILESWFERTGIPALLLLNPRRSISTSLNLGLRYARAEDIIVRLDAHSIYEPEYIACAVRTLENAPRDVAGIGGPAIPCPGDSFERCVVSALYTNPMGLGGAHYRSDREIREADSVYLGAWRAGALLRAGGYNEAMNANEDGEMAARIRKMGLSILRAPLPCRFIVKRGMVGAIRQWLGYGFWRAKMLRRHPDCIRLRHIAIAAASVGCTLLLFSPLRILLAPAFAAYSVAVFRGRAPGERLPVTFASLVFFPAVQFAFACGMLAGALTRGVTVWPARNASVHARINS